MNRYERRLKSIEQAIREQIADYKNIYASADKEDRDPTDEERLEIETHLKAIETLRAEKEDVDANIKTLQRVEKIGDDLGPAISDVRVTSEPHDRMAEALNQVVFPQVQANLGQKFIDSRGYKSMIQAYRENGGRFPEGFTSGPVSLETKGTLGELGAVVDPTRGPIGGGALVPVPQVVPGTVEKLFQPLVFADLLLSGQASGNTVRYVVEGTATSGAAGIPEGGTKLESTLGLTTSDESVKKIATILPVSEEMLEDGPAVSAYINGRLTLFVRIEEERQLFRGTSGGAEVQGIFTSRSVPVWNYVAGTSYNKGEQLFRAMNESMRGSALIEPEWIVMHPTDWQTLRLLKDTAGQYFGGGPFQGPYGAGQSMQSTGQLSGVQDVIWSKPVYVTAQLGGAGTALVGTRANAQVWRRGGLSVEATNSHGNYFAYNLVAIRAEERLGLAVYRPSGYLEVRFGTAAAIA